MGSDLKRNICRTLSARSMLSSQCLWVELAGVLFTRGVFCCVAAAAVLAFLFQYSGFLQAHSRAVMSVVCTLLFAAVVCGVRRLTGIFSLRRQEVRITVSQICVLVGFGIWLLALIRIWNIDKMKDMLAITIVGGVLSIMFQDTIKSVVAFFYVRLHNLVNIGDWIIIPSQSIDGKVMSITLNTVTVENWDTTVSTFPTNLLQICHFQNLQRMVDGKTHGRRVLRSFIIDTGWIQPMHEADIDHIAAALDGEDAFIGTVLRRRVQEADAAGRPVLNAELFRLYLHHWLMNHAHISRTPRLLVRWLEPQPEGLPLQIYTYVIDSSLEEFEWQQSAIVEHLLAAMALFNLQLYQSTSGYDASNNNIFITDRKATYKKYDDATQGETI